MATKKRSVQQEGSEAWARPSPVGWGLQRVGPMPALAPKTLDLSTSYVLHA